MNAAHFIQLRDIPLLYGRVPKVANSSVKAALCRLLTKPKLQKKRTTSDNFWRSETEGQTRMISAYDARMCRGTHFCFSFVRNPFDRLVSAYNNKVIELDEIPGSMQKMGLRHSMSFSSFMEIVAATSDDKIDVHLLPQCRILCLDKQLIPNFIGHLESINEDWSALQIQLQRERLPTLGSLPKKNVRRGADHRDVPNYFKDPAFIRMATQRYEEDLELFYGNRTYEQLITGY